MRVLLSLAGLLVVLFVVFQLVKTQLGSMASLSRGKTPAASAPAAAGTAGAIVTPRDVSRDVAGQISGAMQSGAAARASQPE